MANKRPSATGLTISEIKSAENMDWKAYVRRGSIYEPVIDKMKALKEGRVFEVTPPKGITVRQLQNRLNAATRRIWVNPPAGMVYYMRSTAHNTLAIGCEKGKPRKKPAKKDAKKDDSGLFPK